MTALLASVRSLDEARVALAGGADLIDLKEPSRGALGALDHAAVRICVNALGGRRPLSATVGDDPEMDPDRMLGAVGRMAETGVDYIKVGFFNRPRAVDCARALAPLCARRKLVAVLFADDVLQEDLIEVLASSGFAGAMLDTARKDGKSLRDWQAPGRLRDFVARTRKHGLLSGLAGSLQPQDIPPLLAMGPDYLGFRGALCRNGLRGLELDAAKLAGIRATIPERFPAMGRAVPPCAVPAPQAENNAGAASQSAFPSSLTLNRPAA
jgi:dihydroneopterin aldolase